MSLTIVSDLHVQDEHDPLYASLLTLIRNMPSGGTLVLAGDLFDLFVGSKGIFLRRYSGLFQVLHDAGRRGVKTHYIEGNHDFMVRAAFRGIPGLDVHGDEVVLESCGKRFFVAHGDRVDQGDYKYRFLRSFLRSPLMKSVITVVPDEWVDRVGNASSRKSRGLHSGTIDSLPPDRIERLRKLFRNYAADRLLQGFDYVVLGHCHDLDEMSFAIGDRCGQYINVGFPRVHGSYLAWVPGDEKIRREPMPSS